MTPETNRAVSLYRTLKLREWDTELKEQDLIRKLNRLTLDEFKEYAVATIQIDSAMNDAQRIIDSSEYAYSTQKQLMHRVANAAGLDYDERN